MAQLGRIIGLISLASFFVFLSCEEYDDYLEESWEDLSPDERLSGVSKRCAVGKERGAAAKLRCPRGSFISSIDFASYGLPYGNCNSGYKRGSCHSSESKSVVENRCLDKQSCTVSASNSLFGDPCKRKRKTLKIQYTCRRDEIDDDGNGNAEEDEENEEDNDDDSGEGGDDGIFEGNGDFETRYDDGIMVPERRRYELIIFEGGTSSAERNWNNNDNIIWSMSLRNARGVAASEMSTYNSLWKGDSSINDVKRVIRQGKIHLAVTGNAGNAVALYEFESKKCVYWSKTTASGPHDVEYVPVGAGYLVVANPAGSGAVLEVYDLSRNNRGRASSVSHPGGHSVHWDGKNKLLWAWGSGQSALKSYKLIVQNGKPLLRKQNEYTVNVPGFHVGMGHGGSPMMVNGRRYLILAGKSGILQFDVDSHTWKLLKKAPDDSGLYSNPKGLSYNPETGEIIFTKSRDSVYSLKSGVGARQLNNSEIYKARWWFHNSFSYPQ